MKEKNYRSLVKSISYRITGTITTFLISLIVTGKVEFALSIMSVDFVSKIAIFYFHERMWNKIKFGKIKDTTPLVMEALENVGLGHALNLMPSELSGGMKRRIALARTLILLPKIILYDEPTTGLDPITSKEILLLMMSIQKKYNTSSIIITHDVDCARMISNRMILLVDGINYAEGTFEELSNSDDPKVQAFFK